MLVLSRKAGQKIHIGGDIVVTVVDVTGKFARIGISAPDDVIILRGEVKEQIEYENQLAASRSSRFEGLKRLGSLWDKPPGESDNS